MPSRRIWTQDATATPIISGATNTVGVASLTLTPPAGASQLMVKCSAAFRWGDNATLDGAGTGKGYVPANAEEWVEIPSAGPSIYFKPVTGTANFHFFFYG
jgi:hypothetical protein